MQPSSIHTPALFLLQSTRHHTPLHADLNPSFVEELDCSQAGVTALQFSRFVARNRPVLLRGLGHALQIPALQRWTSREHLVRKLGPEKQLRIAATPEGNADAIVDGVFVEPACA